MDLAKPNQRSNESIVFNKAAVDLVIHAMSLVNTLCSTALWHCWPGRDPYCLLGRILESSR
jgi:hypothetical protein